MICENKRFSIKFVNYYFIIELINIFNMVKFVRIKSLDLMYNGEEFE
jgi:hypothetical protein